MEEPQGRSYPAAEARQMAFSQRRVAKGDLVLEAGTNNRTLLYTIEGRFSIVAVESGLRVALREVGPNEILGEVSFFDGMPVSADVEALTDGVVGELRREDFDRWSVADPILAHRLMLDIATTLSQRVRTLTTRVAALEYALDQQESDSPFRI